MQRRNVEGSHAFSERIAEQFHFYDLSGLVIDRNWNFSAAIEAFEITEKESSLSLNQLLDKNGYTTHMCMNSVFAHSLRVPFFILIHVENTPLIQRYLISHTNCFELKISKPFNMTEDQFIAWWKQIKGTIQNKAYRQQFQRRAHDSYFDHLLESNGLKWGGNIDAYWMEKTSDGYRPVAVIENRFTNKTSLSYYDPNKFFKYGGGDYMTWKPLLQLKDQLNVPLFLMTYSNRPGEETSVGVTKILSEDMNTGLEYMQRYGRPMRPCDNLFHNAADLLRWIQAHRNP